MISIAVEKAAMEIENREALTAGMVNTVRCMFTFSADWDGLDCIFVFSDGLSTISMLPEGSGCIVPHEVLTTAGQTVMVGVYGTDGEDIILPTVWGTLGIVQEGTDPSGDESTDPALPVWSQILAMIGQTDDLATEDNTSLVAAINEAAMSGGNSGEPGKDGATFIPAVSSDGILSWTNDKGLDNPESVSIKGQQGEKGDKGDTGEKGEKGEDGTGVAILGSYSDEEELNTAHPLGSPGDAYLIEGDLYVWSADHWENVGSIKGQQGEKGDTGAQGEKGDKGDTGAQGEKGDTGATGAAGADGKDGADGYTPVKGTDYWTAADRAEMVNDVLAALPTWEGGSY